MDSRSGSDFRIAIADIAVAVIPQNSPRRFYLDNIHRQFLSNTNPDVTIRAHYGQIPTLELEDKLFDSGGLWNLYKSDGKYIISLVAPALGPVPYQIAVMDHAFTSGDIYVADAEYTGKEQVDPLLYPFDEVLLVNLLAQGRGIEVHACGVELDGQALLFLGPSGSGKSTLAELWKTVPQATILGDDRIIIRCVEGQPLAYGTPWHGDARSFSPRGSRLSKMMFLAHGSENALDPISGSEAVCRMLTCSFPTFWDKEGMRNNLAFCERVVASVPCYELRFVPDGRVVDLLMSHT